MNIVNKIVKLTDEKNYLRNILEEQEEIIQEIFREKIDEIDEKIGFTYISFD